MSNYLRPAISNGLPREQALIRRWWHEAHAARGRMVWEYYLEGIYADSVWFPGVPGVGIEEPGKQTAIRFPVRDNEVALCEAKARLTPELIGQALVSSWFAKRAGASVRETVVLAEAGSPSLREAAEAFGLTVICPAQP